MAAGDDFDFGVYGSTPPRPSSLSGGNTFDTGSSFTSALDDEPEGASTFSFESAGPPVLWMWGGIAAAVVGGVIAAVVGSIVPLAWTAWALAGPISIGLFSVFSLRDTKQRSKPLYGERAAVTWIFRAGWVLAFIGVILAALRLADWAGRL